MKCEQSISNLHSTISCLERINFMSTEWTRNYKGIVQNNEISFSYLYHAYPIFFHCERGKITNVYRISKYERNKQNETKQQQNKQKTNKKPNKNKQTTTKTN